VWLAAMAGLQAHSRGWGAARRCQRAGRCARPRNLHTQPPLGGARPAPPGRSGWSPRFRWTARPAARPRSPHEGNPAPRRGPRSEPLGSTGAPTVLLRGGRRRCVPARSRKPGSATHATAPGCCSSFAVRCVGLATPGSGGTGGEGGCRRSTALGAVAAHCQSSGHACRRTRQANLPGPRPRVCACAGLRISFFSRIACLIKQPPCRSRLPQGESFAATGTRPRAPVHNYRNGKDVHPRNAPAASGRPPRRPRSGHTVLVSKSSTTTGHSAVRRFPP